MEKDSLGLKRSCKKTLTDRVLDFFFSFKQNAQEKP